MWQNSTFCHIVFDMDIFSVMRNVDDIQIPAVCRRVFQRRGNCRRRGHTSCHLSAGSDGYRAFRSVARRNALSLIPFSNPLRTSEYPFFP